MSTGIKARRRTVGPAASAGTTITDDFNRANNATSLGTATTGQTWTAHNGTWQILTNAGFVASTTADATATLNGPSGDGYITCDVRLSSTTNRADAGLVFRLADSTNYLLAAITKDNAGTNGVRLFKRIAGTFTQLGSTAMSGTLVNGTTYTVKLACTGTAIEVFVNGTSRISVTDSNTLQSNTRRGLRINSNGSAADDWGSNFDNLVST